MLEKSQTLRSVGPTDEWLEHNRLTQFSDDMLTLDCRIPTLPDNTIVSLQRPRLVIAFHRFGPYHQARVEAAAKHCDVLALEFSRSTKEYDWDHVEMGAACHRVTLCEECDSRTLSGNELFNRLNDELTRFRPDAVAVNGWSDNGAFALHKWCAKNKVPSIVMTESNQHDFARSPFREFVKRNIVCGCSAAVAGGKLSREYLIRLGMHEDCISVGYDVIANQQFARPLNVTPGEVRKQLGKARKYFLASNRFISKKNLSRLLDSYGDFRKQASASWDLVLLGDGPLRADLEAQVKRLALSDFVHFEGFRQYNELPLYYWGASAFIHASTTEQWGLVVNEAMAAGLPCIVSEMCGCAADIVKDGVTGFTFNPLNTEELTSHMLRLTKMTSVEHSRMGAAGCQLISEWTPERFAAGMSAAVATAVSRPLPNQVLSKLFLSYLCR